MKELSEEDRVEFEKAWEYYWYTIKPVWNRLKDSQSVEFEVCAKFFVALKEIRKENKECWESKV